MGTEQRVHGTEVLRPKARIISVIGSELISDDNVAILELVKNSYDADSEFVRISFEGKMLEGHGKIIVSDNGNGMTIENVKHGWMEPANGEKRTKNRSPAGRRVLGEKGIGRFASAKVADRLTLITKTIEGKEIEAHFNWSNFDTSEKYLDEIKCEWEIRDPTIIKEKGTVLIMEPVRESWDDKKIRSLRLALSRLVDPWSPKEDFKISIDFEKANAELGQFSGDILPPPSLGKPHYSIKGVMDSKGSTEYTYVSQRLRKEDVVTDKCDDKDMPMPTCGPFNFEIRAWDRDDLDMLAEETKMTVREIRKDLNDASGISVYRDGFRVMPYGESARKNDWLGLDLRRVQNPTMRLSNNQVVGQVSIDLDHNPELKDQSNREGIIHTNEFENFAYKIVWLLSKLEQQRYQERNRARAEERSGGIFSTIDLKPVINLIASKLPDDFEAKKLVLATEDQINAGIRKAKEVISRYHRLSTLGQLVDVVLHDGNDVLVKMDNQIKIIHGTIHKPPVSISKVDKRLELLTNERERLSSSYKRLEPFGGRVRGPARIIVLEDAIRDVFLLLQEELLRKEVEYSIPETRTEYKVDLSGFESIIVNLLQNSLYWVSSESKQGGKIEVQLTSENNQISIIFSDNGPGVKEQYQDLIFDPYFTTKPDGVGLGLTIAGEQATEYGGTLELLSEGPLKGATFRLLLPKGDQ